VLYLSTCNAPGRIPAVALRVAETLATLAFDATCVATEICKPQSVPELIFSLLHPAPTIL
jgi:hypothetical protein